MNLKKGVKKQKRDRLSPFLFLLIAFAAHAAAEPTETALPSLLAQNHFSVSAGAGPEIPSASQRIALPPDFPPVATIAGVLKTEMSESGQASLMLTFFDAENNALPKILEPGKWEGKLSRRPWSAVIRIPEEAREVEILLRLDSNNGSATLEEAEFRGGIPGDSEPENWIADGGFDYPNIFSPWMLGDRHKIQYPGRNGRGRLTVAAVKGQSSLSSQTLDLKEAAGKTIRSQIQLEFRLNGIKATRKDGGIFVEVDFQDADGKNPQPLRWGPFTGKTDWQSLRSDLVIPLRAKQATFRIAARDAEGTADFDGVRWFLNGKEGLLTRPLESRNDTAGWIPYQSPASDLKDFMDGSSFLSPPAGKHGFLQSGKDGHFYFEDGTRARFFGINLQPPQSIPSHEEAEKIAEQLSRWGFNLVRLHHLDAPFGKINLFDPESEDTLHFSNESLDRLDYLIAKLKEKGIYIYLDLIVTRKYRKDDGVAAYEQLPRGAKGSAQFNRRLIELQKHYARELLTHVNPYTGKRILDDPAIVMTEIANESSLVRFAKGRFPKLPPPYRAELRQLWEKFLADKELSKSRMEKAKFLDFENPLTREFLAGIQRRYFTEMYQFLRDLGVRFPVAGSNFPVEGEDLETNAELDFIDRHAYWDPPRGGIGNLSRFHNLAVMKEAAPPEPPSRNPRWNPIVRLSMLKVRNKPFVVGEWNFDWPNEYRAAGPLLMAAYACFQDWDALIQFNFEERFPPEKIEGNFDVSSKPETFFQYAAVSRLFHRQDVRVSGKVSVFPMKEGAVPPWMGLLQRVERSSGVKSPSLPRKAKAPYQTDTREISWDDQKGQVMIDTPRTQAVVGIFRHTPVFLSGSRWKIENPFAAAGLTALENGPIKESRHLLVTAVARAENSETVYNFPRSLLRFPGRRPILMEPVRGELVFETSRINSGLHVWSIDSSGKRIKTIASVKEDKNIRIPLGEGFLYEIEITSS